MATQTITAGDLAVHAVTLTANTADTVTWAGGPSYGGYRSFEVANHPSSAAPIYVRTDGQAATVAGPRCYIVFPGQAVEMTASLRGAGSVSLVSASAAVYSVTEVAT